MFKTLLLTLISMMALGSTYAFAQSEPHIALKGALNVEALSSQFEYFEDTDWTANIQELAEQKADQFVPINMSEPDFGYIDSRIWLRARLQNMTANNSDWRLYVRENFLQHYSLYVKRESGDIETIESHTLNTPFTDRILKYPEIVTPFTFAPNEKITLYVAYWSEGSSNAAMSLETGDSFSQLAVKRTSKNYIFYGMIFLLISAAFLGLIILRLPVFLAYLTYVILTLFYLMHVDGVTFQYFWPTYPRFNSSFTIIIGTAFVMATYNFARAFLQTKIYQPKADRILFWMGAATPFITIPMAFFDPQLTKQIIMPLVLLAIMSGTIVGGFAALNRFKQVRFYLFAWTVGIFAATVMNMRHVFGLDISQDVEFDSIRVSMVVDSIMMGLGIADRYIQTLKQREKATQDNLKSAQTNLNLNQRLFELEEQYNLVNEIAVTRDKNLRNTIHDLRQPLHALRLNIQKSAASDTQSGEDNAKINETFSYLESLLSEQMQTAISPSDQANAGNVGDISEDVSVQSVLKSVHEMFLPDAEEKGLDFRFIPSRHTADIEPFTLIRITSNLVSNAIKYTPAGKVLLGSRRIKGALRIEVHDSGIGMSETEFQAAKQRQVRLDEGLQHAEGEGLGLSIASGLAAENGLALYRSPYRENGTSLILEIPVKSKL